MFCWKMVVHPLQELDQILLVQKGVRKLIPSYDTFDSAGKLENTSLLFLPDLLKVIIDVVELLQFA